MGQGDSEKRVAEWQRHVAEQGASPGGWERLKTRLAAVAALGLLLITIGYVAYELVAYYAGTPTTATIHECIRGRGNTQDCTVSWSVGGQSHTGTINVDHYYPPGSSRGVRVFAGEAHAAPPPSVMLILLGVIAACAVVGAVVPVVWRRWWRRRTGRSGVEHQLARQKRGANLPPASPDPGSVSRRYVASTSRVKAWYHVYWLGSFAALFALMYNAPAALGRTTGWVVVFVAAGALVLLGLLGALRWGVFGMIPICVTNDGLTVDRRPGDVFSFTGTKLGLWTPGSTMTMSGTALHLRCGPHRLVLGGRDRRIGSGTPLEAPPTGSVDGWMRASDFDELLTVVSRRSGLDVRGPAPEEPIRCLLFPRPSTGAFSAFTLPVRALRKLNPQPRLAIDVGADAVWVIDPNNKAPIASASLAQVTATPADYLWYPKGGVKTPVLIVGVAGLRPLTIGCPQSRMTWQSLFSWRGKVPSAKEPEFMVSDADWLVLVEKFGLAPYLDKSKLDKRREWDERSWRRWS